MEPEPSEPEPHPADSTSDPDAGRVRGESEPDSPDPSSDPDAEQARGEPGSTAEEPGIAGIGPYPALVLLGAVPILVLAVFAYLVSARAVERLVDRGNDAAALITASLVEREFEHWISTVTSHAGFPALSQAVVDGDVDEVRRRLEIIVTQHARLDRAFVSDTTGLLWVDFPVAEESLGRRFDERDWYRGVSRARGPYVSEVYRRHAEPRIQVVAVATPVRSPATGEPAGFLVAQVRLDGLSELLGRVEVGQEGVVLLRDHTGHLAAHPDLDLERDPHPEYADIVLDAEGAAGAPVRGRYPDPVTGSMVLASSVEAAVGDHMWTVLSQQPEEAALAPIRALALRLGVAGVLMGGMTGMLLWGVVRENHRRKRAELELLAMNTELERRIEERTEALREKDKQMVEAQRLEAVGRLAGGVAHDFNNLLTVILGSTDVVLDALPEDDSARSAIEETHRAAERAAALTRQLLAFSSKQVMRPQVLDVNVRLEPLRDLVESVLGEQVVVEWRPGADLHPVAFDPAHLEQLVVNLAVNARDAMPRGGTFVLETRNETLGPETAAEDPGLRPGPYVCLSISDSAPAMDDEASSQLFEPFYASRRFGRGSGLDLAAVHGIVRQGGGHIRVRTGPGRGTTFEVFLPRSGPAQPA